MVAIISSGVIDRKVVFEGGTVSTFNAEGTIAPERSAVQWKGWWVAH
jgi:hypothetical protein